MKRLVGNMDVQVQISRKLLNELVYNYLKDVKLILMKLLIRELDRNIIVLIVVKK